LAKNLLTAVYRDAERSDEIAVSITAYVAEPVTEIIKPLITDDAMPDAGPARV
jgi:hypothetical protein